MAEVKWIKITTDIFDDEKVLLIESLPERDSLLVIWFKLLCMAGRQNNSGVFMLNDRIAYTDEMLATIFRRPLNTVRLALTTFESYGMIEIIDNVITIPKWEKHQNIDGMEKIKEQNRARVAKHREKQKLLAVGNVTSNVTVTECNGIDKEEEKEKNKNKKKNNKKEEALELLASLLPSFIFSDSVKSKMSEWVLYKAERKDFYTETGLKSLLRQVEKNCKTYGEQAVNDLIDECMCNNYKGIIFDKLKTATKDAPKQQTSSETPDFLKKWSV